MKDKKRKKIKIKCNYLQLRVPYIKFIAYKSDSKFRKYFKGFNYDENELFFK